MEPTTIVVGSIAALQDVIDARKLLVLDAGAKVVVIPTAAAFTGLTESTVALSSVFDDLDVNVEGLMVADRSSCNEPYFAQQIRAADVVVLGDGSPLHARSVWRDNPVGEAIRDAKQLVAVGACASVLGEVMIDPRGGAPTTGLHYRNDLCVTVPASDEQLGRTRSLVGDSVDVHVIGLRGVVFSDHDRWRTNDDVVTTRGNRVVES